MECASYTKLRILYLHGHFGTVVHINAVNFVCLNSVNLFFLAIPVFLSATMSFLFSEYVWIFQHVKIGLEFCPNDHARTGSD